MSTTPTTLPPLTPELIEAAKAVQPTPRQHRRLIQYYKRLAPGMAEEIIAPSDAQHHILTRALTARRPIPMGGTKVGDRVMSCFNGPGRATLSLGGNVMEKCPIRGVRTMWGWHRSWVRVKGGDQ